MLLREPLHVDVYGCAVKLKYGRQVKTDYLLKMLVAAKI